MSHEQSQAERGFSINKEIIENLHSSSLSAQRIVYDYLKASKKNIHDVEIRNKMLTSCKSAHSRYLIALEDAKRQSQVTEKETKRKLINPWSANKMVKHTQTICRQIADEMFEFVWPFYGVGASRVKTEIDVKRRRVEVMSCITSLEQDVENYLDEAEDKHGYVFVS